MVASSVELNYGGGMGAPGKLNDLSSEHLRRLYINEGMSDQAIGDLYGVSAPAIAYRRKHTAPPVIRQGRVSRDRFDHHRPEGYLPWTPIRSSHYRLRAVRWLQTLNLLAAGIPVREDWARQAREVEATLLEDDYVLFYDYDTGFTAVARNPEFDTPGDIIRRPMPYSNIPSEPYMGDAVGDPAGIERLRQRAS